MHTEYGVGENSTLDDCIQREQISSLFNYFSADKQHQHKRTMTNEKSSLKNQRDAYFQALENDEKMKKNKRKHGTTNTKSEQMERKKQLDSKRKLALEKLQKKNKSVIITKHSQQQLARRHI